MPGGRITSRQWGDDGRVGFTVPAPETVQKKVLGKGKKSPAVSGATVD